VDRMLSVPNRNRPVVAGRVGQGWGGTLRNESPAPPDFLDACLMPQCIEACGEATGRGQIVGVSRPEKQKIWKSENLTASLGQAFPLGSISGFHVLPPHATTGCARVSLEECGKPGMSRFRLKPRNLAGPVAL
jgi:hypothetical protein